MDVTRSIKQLVKVALGREFFIRPDKAYPKERFGSRYGGWDLVTRDIGPDSVIYSFGIGEDASFDVGVIERFGVTVHGFDPTPKSVAWVQSQGMPPQFVMHVLGIADFDGEISFNPPENPDHVSHTMLERPSTQAKAITVPVERLSTIMTRLGHAHIDVLKMDIEGAEYDVVNDLRRSGIRPGQILIEFHHRFPGVGVDKSKDAIATIRAMGYHLYSVSATNEEFCFIRVPQQMH